MIKIGLYKHFKGGLYQVLAIARHEETYKPLVIYQALYGDYRIWARDLDVFIEEIKVDGKRKPRFEFVGENMTNLPAIEDRG